MSTRLLYVSNLSPISTAAGLQAAFEDYGAIRTYIRADLGVGSVEVNEDEVERAILDMHGKSFDGRILTVKGSELKDSDSMGHWRDDGGEPQNGR